MLGAAAGALVVLLLVFLAGVLVSRGGDDGTNAGPTGSSGAQGVPEPGSAPAAPEGAAPTPSSTPGGTATPDPGPGSGQKPPGTFLDEYKNIGITEGYGISFTDHPERPREGDDAEEFDLHYNSWISADKFGRLDAAADASYEACHRNTLYEDSLFSWETGERWCVYTAEGLLGIFTIKSSESGHLVIDLKVWQGPADR